MSAENPNTSRIYETCPKCAPLRANGDLEAALKCFQCKGLGIYRRPESYICNQCGGCLCPPGSGPFLDHPYGLVEESVSGGYSSPALSDMVTYTFSLCEVCLRTLFASFKVPPRIDGDYAEEHKYYLWRQWEQGGGQRAKFTTGLCNANEECPNPAKWRKFCSGHLTDEAVCDEHSKSGYGNTWLAPVEDVAGVAIMEADRSKEDHIRIAQAWLTSVCKGIGEDRVLFMMYLSECLRVLTQSGEYTGALWVPDSHPWHENPLREMIEHCVSQAAKTTLSDLLVLRLPQGTLLYGPSAKVQMFQRMEWVQERELNIPEDEIDETV